MKPLQDLVESVLGGWPLLKASHTPQGKRWPEMFTQLFSRTGLSPVFRITVQYERHLARKYLFVAPGGTGIAPDNLVNPTLHQKTIDAYKHYMKNAAILLGATDNAKLDEDIEKVIHLETNIAKVSFPSSTFGGKFSLLVNSQVMAKSPLNMIRVGTFAGLNTATNHRIDWLEAVNSILVATKSSLVHFKAADHLAAVNLNFLHDAAEVLDQSTEEVIHNLFSWLLVSVYGPLTSNKFRHTEAQYKAVLTGAQSELPTPEFCFNIVNSKLSFAMGRVYVDTHFTVKEKEAVNLFEIIRFNIRLMIDFFLGSNFGRGGESFVQESTRN